MIFRMVYLSTANGAPSTEELEALMVRAKANNERDHLTGLAAYHDFTFIQVLEGAEEKVRACFDRIRSSDLHRNLVVASEAFHATRMFDHYAMAFVPVAESHQPTSAAFTNLRSLFEGEMAERLQKDIAVEGFLHAFRETLRGI